MIIILFPSTGALHFSEVSIAKVVNSLFSGNQAVDSGGAISIQKTNASIEVYSMIIIIIIIVVALLRHKEDS